MVPSTVAMLAEMKPTRSVTQAALMKLSLKKTDWYHLVEKPAQTVTSLDSLKE